MIQDKDYEALGCWEAVTLGERLENWSKLYGERIAVVEDGEQVTYRELNDRVDRLAAGLAKKGIKKGDKAGLQMPNSISFIVTSFALMKLGAIPIFILPAHRQKEVIGIFEHAKPTAYIVAESFLGFEYSVLVDEVKRNCPYVKLFVTDGETGNTELLKDLYEETKTEYPQVDYKEVAFLLLSGGTTNVPKLIPRTHCDYAYNAKMAAKRSGLTKDSVYLAVLPIAHNFPWGIPGVIGTFSVGGKVVLAKTTSFDEVFPLIEEERVTITAVVPAVLQVWIEVLEWEDSFDLSSLSVLQVGGAKLIDSLAEKVMPAFGCTLQQVFGIAEGLICFTDLEDEESTLTSCQGKPLSEFDEIRIVDENECDVEEGTYGELLMRGPYTIRGYYGCKEYDEAIYTKDGFFRTGDKACITKEGNLLVDGRITDQINRAGEKIMPSEIEELLCQDERIQEAYVVPVPDEECGQKSFAFIKTEEKLELQDVYSYLRTTGLAQYKFPDYIEVITTVPLTNIGKANRKVMKEIAIQHVERK